MRTTRTNVIPLLPADYREAVMLQHARDALAAARGVFFIDGDPFNIDVMRTQVRHMLKTLAEVHERNMARVVELALAGAEDAHEALLDLKAELHARGEPLGPGLQTYDHIVSERSPRFRRPAVRPRENFLAAFVIVCLLIDLMQQFPELPLRRSSKRRPCACSIISTILIEAGLGRGGEDAIYKIWKRYGPLVNPGYRWNRKPQKK
jgi:hypothetical protein